MDPIDKEIFKNDRIEIASLPRYEEVELSSLSPKFLIKLNIVTTFNMLIFLGILVVGYAFIEEYRGYFPLFGVVVLLIFLWSYFVNYQLQKKNGYAVRERDLIFRRGFLYERTTVVPFNRIQHVSTGRTVLDKALGIATLKVFTAGGSGSDIAVPGLLPETATALKEELSVRMSGHV